MSSVRLLRDQEIPIPVCWHQSSYAWCSNADQTLQSREPRSFGMTETCANVVIIITKNTLPEGMRLGGLVHPDTVSQGRKLIDFQAVWKPTGNLELHTCCASCAVMPVGLDNNHMVKQGPAHHCGRAELHWLYCHVWKLRISDMIELDPLRESGVPVPWHGRPP